MAVRKRKLFRALVVGTGVNETILVMSHEIVSFPSSTYHKFVFPDGVVMLKNDFGVSCVTLHPVDMTDEELERHGY